MKCSNQHTLALWIGWIRSQTPTGSRVIGGWCEESDYDYVAIDTEVQAHATCLDLSEPQLADPSRYGEEGEISFKYRLEESDPCVNLIVVPDGLIGAWKFATHNCAKAYGRGFLRSKKTRVQMFEAYKASYLEKQRTGGM